MTVRAEIVSQRETLTRVDPLTALIPTGPEPLIEGPGAAAARSILDRVWGDPRASMLLPRAFREQRSLNSAARRGAQEGVYEVLRHHALLLALLRAGGWSEAKPGEAAWWMLAVLRGLPPDDAAARFGEDVFGALVAELLQGLVGAERRALLASLPLWLAEQVDDDFAASCGTRALVTVRANPRRTTRVKLLRELRDFEPEEGRLSDLAVHLRGRGNLYETASWKRGDFEVQDEGSQLIAELVDPHEGAVVADLCAGAGGKALAIASLGGCRVHIHDIRSHALKQAANRARRAGVQLNLGLPSVADRVLVDAPCTGTGTLRRDPARRWRLTPDFLEEMTAAQRQVLEQAHTLLRPGGRLIYATCSVCPAENREQVDAFLARHPEYRLLPTRDILGEKALFVGDGQVLSLWPQIHGTDGFFGAVMTRG